MAYTTPTLFFSHLTMDKKYTCIFKFLDGIIEDIEKFKEIDSKRWLPDQELHGWEDMIDNLQEHIEEIRGWDPDPQPDGEGGWEQTADPVEWAQIDHEAERAFTKKQFAEQELTKVIEEVNGVPLHARTWVDIPDPNEC